ncbi:unnamed protein product [Urochloa decumbens]|uniref:F-box domain-containing protein n=1 Tax=Urochloa decumbens TaxID=240449 RepID=A0ABC9AXR3_9POAL
MELEEAFRNRGRTSGGGGGCSGGGPDRLSALPDCLIHVIMSFMKSRQAVQTCVLSRRWRYLWHSVPCLDIDFDEFKKTPCASGDSFGTGGNGNSGSNDDVSDSDSDSSGSDADDDNKKHKDKDEYKDWEDFEGFAVNMMLSCNIAQLDSFRLRIDVSRAPVFGYRQAAGWLRRAMKYCTPDPVSQRKGLSSGYWRLKRLHLCQVPLDNRFMKHVGSVCHSLEDLELDSCTCEIQSITSNSLKNLVLKDCRWRKLSDITSPTLKTLVIDDGVNGDTCLLVILAPAISNLHLDVFVDDFSGGISINKVSSLAKASIILKGHIYERTASKLCGSQFKLLCSISNAISLELAGVGTTVLGEESRFQEFKNLRNLLLANCDLSDNFRTLVFFLKSSPNLEKLTLQHCMFPKYSKENIKTPILNKTSSSEFRGLDLLCENLKVEIIYEYGYGPHLIQLLLRISVNLSKNNIKLTKVK